MASGIWYLADLTKPKHYLEFSPDQKKFIIDQHNFVLAQKVGRRFCQLLLVEVKWRDVLCRFMLRDNS